MGEHTQINRWMNLLRRLQTRGCGFTLTELSEEFGVSDRTIQRDIDGLIKYFPIKHQTDDLGRRYWRLERGVELDTLSVSFDEAISLQLAEKFLSPLAGTVFADGYQSLLGKLRSIRGADALNYLGNLENVVLVRGRGQTDYTAQTDIVRTTAKAIREEITLDVTYRALWSGEQYTTGFDPYGLVVFESDLYAVGRSHRAGELRIFKVSRIADVRTTAQRFERPDDFRLETYFKSAFGIVQTDCPLTEVAVRFTGMAATLVEERSWHESQRLHRFEDQALLFNETTGDDAVIATYELADLSEFKRWLMGFGAQATVLRPDALRKEMAADLLAAARQYSEAQ